MIVNGEDWSDDEMRQHARALRITHDPAEQGSPYHDRCEHCHYTRHPCDVYDLASLVLALLERP